MTAAPAPVWMPADLAAWQDRLGLNGAEAARRLGLLYLTYRGYLPGGRRHRDGLPGWLPVLCTYVERHGPLPPGAVRPGATADPR